MATTVKQRHHRVEARRARRRERTALRTPEQEKERCEYKRRQLERGAVRQVQFFLAIGKWARAHTKTTREERAERNKDRQLSRRSPLTKRYLELVELSQEQAVREKRQRKWLPVDQKRAEGRLKRLLARKETREQRFAKSQRARRFPFPRPESSTLTGAAGA